MQTAVCCLLTVCFCADPNTPKDAPPRESIELRAYVFWENEPAQDIALEL